MDYFVWYDETSHKSAAQNIQEAVTAYVVRFSEEPPLILVNTNDQTEVGTKSLLHTPVQRVTRYNLILSFEELYTTDSQQLRASAEAITSIIRTIETLVETNAHIQAMLAEQHLTIATVAPARILPTLVHHGFPVLIQTTPWNNHEQQPGDNKTMPISPNPWALTQRQEKILARLSDGESTVRIGLALGLKGVAIRTELNRIYARLGVTT